MVKCTETEVEWWLPELVQGTGELVFRGNEGSAVTIKKVLEIDGGGGGGCTRIM